MAPTSLGVCLPPDVGPIPWDMHLGKAIGKGENVATLREVRKGDVAEVSSATMEMKNYMFREREAMAVRRSFSWVTR